jgi:hypothetical protein
MREFLRGLTQLLKRPAFSSKWFAVSFAFFVTLQFLDGLTTKIGLNFGLLEVGTYAKGVLADYGFWGLMAWKYCILAVFGVMLFLTYYRTKKYAPKHFIYARIILTIGCLLAGLATIQVVFSNISQIMLAIHA